MVPVQIGTRRDKVSIPVLDSPSVVRGIQHERIGALAQAVQARILWKLRPESDVLALEDHLSSAGIEEHLAAVAACDGEREWVCYVMELERIGTVAGGAARWSGQDFLRNLVDLLSRP